MVIEKDEVTIYDVETIYKEILKEYESDSVVVDLNGVNKLDMGIIQLFVSLQKSCKKDSKKFELKNCSSEVAEILKKCACEFLLRKIE